MSDNEVMELRWLTEYDWLTTDAGRLLHYPVMGDPDPDVMGYQFPTFACGRNVKVAWIPGVFTRMGAERCSRCCDRLGYPHGTGSPKNDEACKARMVERLEALR